MKCFKRIPLIWWLYIALGLISAFFIVAYWIEPIYQSIRNVLMSIGASLIGAVVLGIFIELITNKKKKKLKKVSATANLTTCSGHFDQS